MDLYLMDWTRMGNSYCLAGATQDSSGFQIIRPLLAQGRRAGVANAGWAHQLLTGHGRWHRFELVQCALPPVLDAPHLEDRIVAGLRPRRVQASQAERRAMLKATLVPDGEPLFGYPLTRGIKPFLEPGQGTRSLTSAVVPAASITFSGSWRDGSLAPDIRVSMNLPELGHTSLPVQDHFLLARVEKVAHDLDEQLALLHEIVQAMGPTVLLRLGLSRPYGQPPRCWVLANGFFSPDDPQG